MNVVLLAVPSPDGDKKNLRPGLEMRPARLHWSVLRAHLPFGLTSQLTNGAQWVLWDAAPVLIGLVLGSARIVPEKR